MDVIASIDPNALTDIFGWNVTTVDAIIEMVKNRSVKGIKTYADARNFSQEKIFFDICEFMFERASDFDTTITANVILNPFRDWKRLTGQNMFQKGGRREAIPNGTIANMLNADELYIIKGYKDSGSNASVHTFVIYKGKICVMKVMKDDAQPDSPAAAATPPTPRYIHTSDMYEIVSQIFMHRTCRQHAFVSVPEVLAARSGPTTGGAAAPLYAIMERAKGKEMAKITMDDLPFALSLLMKALFILQKEVHFMHRDLHARNVFYDSMDSRIHLIDFGMCCINPGMESIAWQGQQYFYPILEETRNARCDNPSLDVCCIISSLALVNGTSTEFGQFLNDELVAMKAAAKYRLERIKNCQTVREMVNDNSDFTRIRTRNWQVGNKTPANTNYWVYELGQIDLIRWYPEHMLARLLQFVPLDKWKYVRASFDDIFDTIAPKLRVELNDGREGTLQKIHRQTAWVKVDGATVRTRLDLLTVIKTRTITV